VQIKVDGNFLVCLAHSLPDPSNCKPLSNIDNKYKNLDAVIKNTIAGEGIRKGNKGTLCNAVKLIDVNAIYVVIVANVAIHCDVTIGFKMDTGLRRHDGVP
jgi:hypothetical protein